MDPPRSDAMPIGEHRELTSPPSPPELPPTVRPSSHGFLTLPISSCPTLPTALSAVCWILQREPRPACEIFNYV